MSATTNTTVNTIAELLVRLRETKGSTTGEAFNTLRRLVGNDVRIRYEVIKGDDESENAAAEKKAVQSANDDLANLAGETDAIGETLTGGYAHLNGANVRRVLLTSNRLKADFSREFVRYCNGLVLEYPSWNIIAMPTAMFNPRYRNADIVANIDSYALYKIRDGTTVTLYHFDGQWRLSSSNGYDVTDYQWMGPSTYMQAFMEVSRMFPEFKLDKLSTDKSYTIGFRHPEFHPLPHDPSDMWLIQACDLAAINNGAAIDNKVISETENVGLPVQTPLSMLPKGKKLFRLLQQRNESALDDYTTSIQTKGCTPNIHYGYMLKGVGLPTGSSVCNIILESSLLKQIRFLMYNLPKRRFTEATPVTANNRLEYTILRAYLSCTSKYVFLNLFPQFGPQYQKYDVIFGKLTDKILGALRNKTARASLANSTTKADESARIDRLAYALVMHIEDCGRINTMTTQGPSIVLDFIMDKGHLDLYYTCLIAPVKG